MRIHFERTGGVAGSRLACEIVSDRLPPDEQRRLGQLVAESGVFNAAGRLDQSGCGADRFEYSITIDAGSSVHAVRVGEAAVPSRLRPLITWLTAAARARTTRA